MPISRNPSKRSSTIQHPVRPDAAAEAIAPLKDKVFGVLVCAATFHDDHVLLLRRSEDQKFMPGEWSIPAGKIQPLEESLEDAVCRELYEEAGIKGRVRHGLGMCWFESRYYDQLLHHIQFNFVVDAEDRQVKLMDKSNMDHLWLSVHQIHRPPVRIDDFTSTVLGKAVDYHLRHR
ncbi:NUDIX hydrolase [Acrocarpospora sp. B8E8]|uniref:NUDIX hydrolase n=1 Tax=Acrocarpospora sp. B8E8 TaxID=3153572 RepID=UPI00325DE9A1